jgi:hypothetical protein
LNYWQLTLQLFTKLIYNSFLNTIDKHENILLFSKELRKLGQSLWCQNHLFLWWPFNALLPLNIFSSNVRFGQNPYPSIHLSF